VTIYGRSRAVRMLIMGRQTLTVNVVSTFLMALMLLPKLRESAEKFGIVPRISIVSSLVHHYTELSAKSSAKILDAMNAEEHANMRTRSTHLLPPLDRGSADFAHPGIWIQSCSRSCMFSGSRLP